MSATQLARLTELSERQTEHHRRRLAEIEHEMHRLQQQRDELIAFADSYQHGVLAQSHVVPAMLGVRRQFVSGVLAEAGKLKQRIEALAGVLDQRQASHRRSASESLALASMQRQAHQDEYVEMLRQERHQLDEAARQRTVRSPSSGQAMTGRD